MKKLAGRVWHEPAVALGLLASIAEAVVIVATGDPWDTAAITAVILPLAAALGVRELVRPLDLGPVPGPGQRTEEYDVLEDDQKKGGA